MICVSVLAVLCEKSSGKNLRNIFDEMANVEDI